MTCTLAKKYTGQPVEGWLMSEKLDGVRALWDGHQFTSRNGNHFAAPAWFTEALPVTPMDGELYMGRGMFQQTAGAVRRKAPLDSDWQRLQFHAFDSPAHPGTFAERLDHLRNILAGNAAAVAVDHQLIDTPATLGDYFATITNQGAEGVMIRNPAAPYDQGRTANLLKYKPTDSNEAVVIGHQPGEGKHAGRLGALVCQWAGAVFNIGTGLADALRDAPPVLGAMVTFSHEGLTDGGIPRFPVFIAVRDYE